MGSTKRCLYRMAALRSMHIFRSRCQIAWRPPAGMRQRLFVAYEDGDLVSWGLTPDALVLEVRARAKIARDLGPTALFYLCASALCRLA